MPAKTQKNSKNMKSNKDPKYRKLITKIISGFTDSGALFFLVLCCLSLIYLLVSTSESGCTNGREIQSNEIDGIKYILCETEAKIIFDNETKEYHGIAAERMNEQINISQIKSAKSILSLLMLFSLVAMIACFSIASELKKYQ